MGQLVVMLCVHARAVHRSWSTHRLGQVFGLLKNDHVTVDGSVAAKLWNRLDSSVTLRYVSAQ